MCCLEEVYRCLLSDMFSVVNVYLDHLKFCVVCINGRMYVCLVNIMLSLMSVMSPPPALCNLSLRIVMYFGCFDFRGELGFLNCDVCRE